MAKEKDVQIDLIDVKPKNAKAIDAVARDYKKAQRVRKDALQEEVELKGKLLGLIRESGLLPDEEGNITYIDDGMTITVKPRDELVRVTIEGEDD